MRTRLTALALSTTLALSACGGEGADTDAAADGPLRVAVTPVPNGEILDFVATELAPEAGLEIEVVEFTDFIQPNVALDDGSVDANYYQTLPFLEEQEAGAGYDFTETVGVSILPMALYSESVTDLVDLPEGAQVAIPNDPTQGGRALRLLEANDLITIESESQYAPTSLDITDNPKGIEIVEVEAAQAPRSLADVDAAVINGNYAIEADLSAEQDSLVVEDPEGSPHINYVVARTGEEKDPRVQLLGELLTSQETRDYIAETYDGSVLSAP